MENKKEHKILKIILYIILALIIIFAIHTFRNYIIINEVSKKQSELSKKTNFYFVSEQYDYGNEDADAVLERFTKDDNSKILRTDSGKNFTMWGGKEETIIISETNLKATICKTLTPLKNYMPIIINTNSVIDKIGFAMFSIITSNNVDERECYDIKTLGLDVCIDKENGTTLAMSTGKVVKDGKEYESVIKYKNYKFDELTDADVARPDLTGYEVAESKEN